MNRNINASLGRILSIICPGCVFVSRKSPLQPSTPAEKEVVSVIT